MKQATAVLLFMFFIASLMAMGIMLCIEAWMPQTQVTFSDSFKRHQFDLGFISFYLVVWAVCFLALHACKRISKRIIVKQIYEKLERKLQVIIDTKHFDKTIDPHAEQISSGLAHVLNTLLSILKHEITERINLARLRIEDQMAKNRLTQYDKLTTLPNRLYFTQTLQNELDQAKNEGSNRALILIDLLEFKSVNDVYGLDVGDKVLVKVAKRFEAFALENSIVSRLSSDEFLLLMPKEIHELDLLDYASDLIVELTRPYQVDNWQIRISVTCGIATTKEANYQTSELLANVDIAQQYAKQHSSQHFSLYVPAMKADKLREQQIAASIQNGLDTNEFFLHYQGKVNKHEKIVGYEALLRWRNDGLGALSPAEFIPIAERSGKIRHLTNWVIKQVFSDLSQLLEYGGQDLKVAINLSAIDLKTETLLSTIEQGMLEYGINGKNLEFEITETGYLENIERVNIIFDKLKGLGCTVALDDFGTGYSSLSYLTQIHVNVLKLDKQFVDELNGSQNSRVITESIVKMAHQLDMTVCAEGIETAEQAQQLIDIGCEELQGFYYSKPATLDAQLLRNSL